MSWEALTKQRQCPEEGEEAEYASPLLRLGYRARYGDSVRGNRQGQLPERVKHAYEECRPSALV